MEIHCKKGANRYGIHISIAKISSDIFKSVSYVGAGLDLLAIVLVHRMSFNCSDSNEYGFQCRSHDKHLLELSWSFNDLQTNRFSSLESPKRGKRTNRYRL
jgi:hypothetical protein